MPESRLSSLKLISRNQTHYSQTSRIQTPKGQSEVSVLERCPYIKKRSLRWHHFYDSTYSFKWSVAKTRLTLIFKLHLSLLIHRCTKALSFSSVQNCTYQLHTYSHRQITVLRRNELQRNAACKKLWHKAQFWKRLSLFCKCSKQ